MHPWKSASFRLERANRILITLLVVGLVALGSLALAQQPTAEEVRAQKFVLVDPDTNQELAVLGRDATGTFLRLTNQGGALTASVGSDRPRLVGEDRNGKPGGPVRPEAEGCVGSADSCRCSQRNSAHSRLAS